MKLVKNTVVLRIVFYANSIVDERDKRYARQRIVIVNKQFNRVR